MPTVSSGDLALLRRQAHKSDVYVSFLVPPILWKARIDDGSIVKGQTSFTYDQGTGSHYGLIGAFQEIWVGTTDGDNDVGVLRVRGISTGDGGVTGGVTVAGHSLPLQDNQYLTFLHHYPLRPRYSYVDPATGVWYMDTIIAYTDEHEKPPPVVVAGPHRAGFLDDTPEFIINVDVSGSYAIANGASVSSYALSVASTAGTPVVTFNTSTGLGDIEFTAPGYYWAKYTVTDSNGKSQDSYRCYFVHEDDRSSSWYPFVDMESLEIGGDWDSGGWIATMDASDNYSFEDIPSNTLAVIWRRSWYGATEKNITYLPDQCSTIFAGYVRDEMEQQDFAAGTGLVDFALGTVEGKLRQIYSFSASIVAQKTSVDDWFEGPNWMTAGIITHFLLRWRSTLFEVADVIGLNNNTLRDAGFEPDDANLYDMVTTYTLEEGIRAKLICDQGGRMHLAYDVQLLTDSERGALSTAFDIKKDAGAADYGGTLTIPRQPEKEVPFVTTDGVYWDGTDWDENDYPESTGDWCVIAPGGVGLEDGPAPKDFPRQIISSLNHLKELGGRFLARVNNPIEEIRIDFAGDYLGALDVAYDDAFWTISLQASDTPRGKAWTDKRLFCRNIVARFRGDEGMFHVSASFEVEADGIDGEETDCPGFPLLGGSIPTLPFPNGVPDSTPGALLTGASVNYKSAMTNDWTERISQDVLDLIVDPFWRAKQASTDPSDAIVFRCGVGYIKRSTDAFISVDVDVTPSTNPPNIAEDSPAPTATGVTYVMGEGSISSVTAGWFTFIARWQNASNNWRSWACVTKDNGTTWAWKYLGDWPSGCAEPGTKSSSFTSSYGSRCSRYSCNDLTIEVATDKYVTLYVRSLNTYVRAFSINPTTKVTTFGSEVNIGAWTGGPPLMAGGGKLTKVDTDKFAVSFYLDYVVDSSTYYVPTAKIGTISGETITLGSIQNLFNDYEIEKHFDFHHPTIYLNPQLALVCPNSSTIIAFRPNGYSLITDGDDCVLDDTTYRRARWGTISGTTITWSEISNCGNVDLETVGLFYNIDSTDLDSNAIYNDYTIKKVGSVGLAFWVADPGLDDEVLKVAAMTAAEGSKSNPVEIDHAAVGNYLAVGLGAVDICVLSSTKALVVWQKWIYAVGVENYYKVYGAVITVSGASSPTIGSDQLIFDLSGMGDQVWIEEIQLTALSSTQVVMKYYVEAYPDFECSGLTMLDVSGDTITVDENCMVGMHIGFWTIQAESATEFMAIGTNDPTTSDYSGRVWAGITAGDIETCNGEMPDSYAMGLTLAKDDVVGEAWVTAISGTTLELMEIQMGSRVIAQRIDLGSTTVAQVLAQTYLAYPFIPFGYEDTVYVYGRMNDPESLGSPAHVIRTINAGAAFTLIEDGWGVDHCGALILTTSNYLYAIRNRGTQAKLYKDNADNILVVKLTLPFGAEVAPHGMLVDFVGGDVHVCSWAADAIMVVKIPPPLLVASDITYNHDNTEGIWSIIEL